MLQSKPNLAHHESDPLCMFLVWKALLYILIIIIMGSYYARHIYSIGYSRRRCGATTELIRQPQTHPHSEEPEIRNRILCKGVQFLACRRKPECLEKTYQGGHGIGKPNLGTTNWQAALVKDQVFDHLTNPPCHRGSENPDLINTLYQLSVEVNRSI